MSGLPLILSIGVIGAALLLIVVALRGLRGTRLAYDRFFADDSIDVEQDIEPAPPVRRVVRRHYVLPVLAAVAIGVLVYFALRSQQIVGNSLIFAVTAGLIAVVLAYQIDAFLYGRKSHQLELQLADAVDIMTGTLSAGGGATSALEAAAVEAKRPLRNVLQEVLARIRFGDDPQDVFTDLTRRVPLETFLLFGSTLAVHWEVGGSLAPTLSNVGRTIRDRIETSRRIRANSVQAQFSTLAVLAVTYFLADLMWQSDPPRMREFLSSSTAVWFVVGTMLLQALGIAWMASIARMRF